MDLLRANHILEKLNLHSLEMQEGPYFCSFHIDEPIDALSWLKDHDGQPTIYWCSRDGNTEYAGIGLRNHTIHRYVQAQTRLTALPYPLRAFGGCSFSKNSDGWGHFGQEKFGFPESCTSIKEINTPSHTVFSPIQRYLSLKTLNKEPTPVHTPSKQIWKQQIENSYEAFSSGQLKNSHRETDQKINDPRHPLDVLRTVRAQQSASLILLFLHMDKTSLLDALLNSCSPSTTTPFKPKHSPELAPQRGKSR